MKTLTVTEAQQLIDALQAEVKQLRSENKQLEYRRAEINYNHMMEIDALEAKHQEEIEDLKALYAAEIKEAVSTDSQSKIELQENTIAKLKEIGHTLTVDLATANKRTAFYIRMYEDAKVQDDAAAAEFARQMACA